ncbi:hypothetical protein MTO96_033618 [Rhipicephalus appendiculatus]
MVARMLRRQTQAGVRPKPRRILVGTTRPLAIVAARVCITAVDEQRWHRQPGFDWQDHGAHSMAGPSAGTSGSKAAGKVAVDTVPNPARRRTRVFVVA